MNNYNLKIGNHDILFLFLVHCRNLHPIFRKVAEKYRENDKIIFARMDLGEFKPFDLKVSFLAAG